MLQRDDRISVSKMAEIHKLSRQTLIFYDKIDLFRPDVVEENGYRYYSYKQIPYLREICFLKSVGVKLEEIKEHIAHRDAESAISLLRRQNQRLSEKIVELTQMQRRLEGRLERYQDAERHGEQLDEPSVLTLPERQVIFLPWGTEEVTRKVLHMTLMKAWTLSEQYDALPPSSWGALVPHAALSLENPLWGAGAYVTLSGDCAAGLPHVQTLPAGEYACMFKYGMPYDPDGMCCLKRWIEENGYEMTGDVVDECFLDTTFYKEGIETDFCQLQIPVRKKGEPAAREGNGDEQGQGAADSGYQRSQWSHSGYRAAPRTARQRPL